jgi:hypothetical protein
MSLRRRKVHPTETYRFSITPTLSDYPLLIGEILRRNAMRAAQQAKRRTLFYELGKALGIRIRRPLGNPNNGFMQ